MRLLGIVLTATVIFFMANYISLFSVKRLKTLENTVLFIKYLKTQIAFSKTPLEKIFESSVSSNEFRFCNYLNDCLNYIKKGEEFNVAWEKSLNKFSLSSHITDEDKRIMLSFANGLGSSDVKGQTQNCDTYINILELKIKDLQDSSKKTKKITNSLGALLAAFIVIALI